MERAGAPQDSYAPIDERDIVRGTEALEEVVAYAPAVSQAPGARPYQGRPGDFQNTPHAVLAQSAPPVANFLTVRPFTDEEALGRVAAAYDTTAEELLARPVSNLGEVFQLLRTHHEHVTLAELNQLRGRTEAILYALARELSATQAELADVGQEARTHQLQESRTMVVMGNFTRGTPPQARLYALMEALDDSEAFRDHLYNHLWLDVQDGTPEKYQALLALMRGLPATARRGAEWSDVTVVQFASVDVRTLFLNEFSRTPFQCRGRRVRVTPSTPLYARKKEGVLRTVMNAVNMHPDHEGSELTPLWHSLTLMQPQPRGQRIYDRDADAWAKVTFRRTPLGRAVCVVQLDRRCRDVIFTAHHAPTPEMPRDATYWAAAWNAQWWGRMAERDVAEAAVVAGEAEPEMYAHDGERAAQDAEIAAARAAAAEVGADPSQAPPQDQGMPQAPADDSGEYAPVEDKGKGKGKGGGKGKSPHWSRMFTAPGGEYYAPFNYEVIFEICEPGEVEYPHEEYRAKLVRYAPGPPPMDAAQREEANRVDDLVAAGAAAAGQPVVADQDTLMHARAQAQAASADAAAAAAALAPVQPPPHAQGAASSGSAGEGMHAPTRPQTGPAPVGRAAIDAAMVAAGQTYAQASPAELAESAAGLAAEAQRVRRSPPRPTPYN